jgi:hypothetical protein
MDAAHSDIERDLECRHQITALSAQIRPVERIDHTWHAPTFATHRSKIHQINR